MEVEAKEYRLTTVSDFVDIATPENLQTLLTDFGNYLLLAISPKFRDCIPRPHSFGWINDGKHDVFLLPVVPDAANPSAPPVPRPEAWVDSDDDDTQ